MGVCFWCFFFLLLRPTNRPTDRPTNNLFPFVHSLGRKCGQLHGVAVADLHVPSNDAGHHLQVQLVWRRVLGFQREINMQFVLGTAQGHSGLEVNDFLVQVVLAMACTYYNLLGELGFRQYGQLRGAKRRHLGVH